MHKDFPVHFRTFVLAAAYEGIPADRIHEHTDFRPDSSLVTSKRYTTLKGHKPFEPGFLCFFSDRILEVLGSEGSFNQNLERAGRVADFLEFAEVLTLDALHRKESCGGHFREESQTPEGEAKRDDENFCYVGAWEYKGDGIAPELSKEPLTFDNVHLATRSYK